MKFLRRWPANLLLLVFLALGTGAFEYVHNLQHVHSETAHAEHHDQTPAPGHDQTNCFLHSLLRAPMMTAAWVPLLVCLGLFVAFLSLITPPLVSRRPIFTLACRGPPAC